MDFGYICPTELMVVEDKLHEFQQEECEVLAISTGSIMSKVALMSLEKDKGGVAGIKFVPPEGKEGQIGSMYRVMKEDSGGGGLQDPVKSSLMAQKRKIAMKK